MFTWSPDIENETHFSVPSSFSLFTLTVNLSASSRTITLLVGEQEVSFFIHEGILCENCHFFASACKPEWMREDDPKIELPEIDHELIEVLVYCKQSQENIFNFLRKIGHPCLKHFF
jgi:hypothetical protein